MPIYVDEWKPVLKCHVYIYVFIPNTTYTMHEIHIHIYVLVAYPISYLCQN